jgi:endonuclease YncB( thermonuclease family)
MSRHWNPPRRLSRRKPASRLPVRLALLVGMLLGLAFAFHLLSSGRASAAGGASALVAGRSVSVIDGDTFHYGGEKIRIADIDTPELRGRCAYETALAARATERMAALLAAGPFELQRVGRDEDRYGRKLRVVTRNGRSLGDQMVSEGLARTWSGRREPWCA